MIHLYFFTSTNKRDKLSTLTIASSSFAKARMLATLNFIKNRYKGKPILAV